MLWTLGQLRAGRPLKATDVAARFEVGVRTGYCDPDFLSFMELDSGPLPEEDPDVFREVLAGLTRGRRLVIRYASASSGRTLDRPVDPYRVLNFRGQWYLVAFAPRQARWIRERRWHRSARVQERLDGGCVLRMRVAVTSELVRWVLQYGPEAEVLAPKRLRREVVERLGQAIASYQAAPVPPKRARQDQHAHR
jgi:predicted DNA-binding transcriptional regulator YafY